MIKLIFFSLLTLSTVASCPQIKNTAKNLETWMNAIVNIETEGYVYPQYIRDSILKSKKDSAYIQPKLDSISKLLAATVTSTGTAIYIIDNGRKYLITAKHILFDSTSVKQKKYENETLFKNGDKYDLEAIYQRISIRTPFNFASKNNEFNNFSVLNNNFTKAPKPYIFITSATGDGIGIISLQGIVYKTLDTLLQKNGYVAISIDKIASAGPENINVDDEIYTIGFPEGVSVVARTTPPPNTPIYQTLDVVVPFICSVDITHQSLPLISEHSLPVISVYSLPAGSYAD